MIHGAKLLNKNKIHKALCVKNEKKSKKKIQKIENMQRSGVALKKRGCPFVI